jgi:hypothetical protein
MNMMEGTQSLYCMDCGARVRAAANFCGRCGTRQEPRVPDPPATPLISTAHPNSGPAQRKERLLQAIRNIASVSELPPGRLDQLAPVREVIDAANDLARVSELESLLDTIDSEKAGFPDTANTVGMLAKLRVDDRLVIGHGDDDLTLLRVDFVDTEVDIPEIAAALRATAAGSMKMHSAREDEGTSVSFAGEFQFIVGGAADTIEGLERQLQDLATSRHPDEYGLQGTLLVSYPLGVGFRAVWGSGTATLTDHRMIGVIFDDAVQGRPRSTEDAWMPYAGIASDVSSVIVFDIPGAAVKESEVIDNGLIGKRIPYTNLHGHNFSFSCQTVRIFESGHLVRPKKGILGGALRAFGKT